MSVKIDRSAPPREPVPIVIDVTFRIVRDWYGDIDADAVAFLFGESSHCMGSEIDDMHAADAAGRCACHFIRETRFVRAAYPEDVENMGLTATAKREHSSPLGEWKQEDSEPPLWIAESADRIIKAAVHTMGVKDRVTPAEWWYAGAVYLLGSRLSVSDETHATEGAAKAWCERIARLIRPNGGDA